MPFETTNDRGEQNADSMQLLSNGESLVKKSHNRIVLSCKGLTRNRAIKGQPIQMGAWVKLTKTKALKSDESYVGLMPSVCKTDWFFITAKMFFFLERSKLL